jgi:hypothetical protein
LSVRNSEEAEEIAKKFLLKRFDFSEVVFDSVDFDGEYFHIQGYGGESESSVDKEKTRFVLQIRTDGNVVGWKLT